MSALLRQLIDCLYQRDIRPTSEELADVLWLALRMDELDRANAPTTTARAETKSATQPEQPVAGQAAEPPGSKTGGPTLPAGVEQRLPVFAETAPVSALTADGITMGARSLRAPAAPALPEALALSRALRPLLRKVPSRSHFMLDESATAERYADQKLWLPIFKGQPERWLELALVVEDSPSLRVWQPTLAGLYRLLARHGAFRDVRWWWLRTDPKGRPVLGKRTADSQPRAPRELLHPEGRRLVIVVSDCASPFWYDPRFLDPLLRLWGQRQPLALLHLLPPHYWSRGGLGRANFTRFRALAPGQPNAWLVADKTGLPTRAFYLPIFTLEPESVALWAGVLAGQSRARCPGRILGNAVATLPPRDRGRIPAQQRLRDFRSNASPEAQLLLRYCATVPLTLPVMRLLQTEVLRQTQQLPLAEIFLSGLLLRKNPQETDPDRFIYDFHSDLQALLLDTLRAPQILDIHQRLSEAVRRNLGRSADFLAFIPDLLEEGGLRLDARSLPFAEVGVTVLRRLGGHYVEHAERLAREIKHITTAIAAGEHARIDERVSETMREKAEAAPSVPTPFRDSFPDGAPGPAMVWLPGGPFTMGDDKSPRDNEKPAHPVTLSHFGIGQYPVTFEEYDRFCEAMHRDKPNDQGWGRGRRPVIDVSWDDAQAYCQWLSQQTGQDYRLLTEAQWEYACRAGRDAAYCFGDDEKPLEDYAWYWKNSEGQTHPVGEKQGNVWGLHDLHGNVWEWVQDWHGAYSKARRHDPSGPESGSNRVIRGGSWDDVAEYCRSAVRHWIDPGNCNSDLGFRLARTGLLFSYPFTLPLEPPKPEWPEEPVPGLRDRLADGSPGPAMVCLPGGTFVMGSESEEEERPTHEVTVDAFSIGQYPVTFEQYDKFCEASGMDKPDDESLGRATRPVINISWDQARIYCEWLSQQTGESYRLPTEAEWEYACRAGTTTRYCFGNDRQLLEDYAWNRGNSQRHIHPVGEKLPNHWQLYDMHGNVWEWVYDWHTVYRSEPQTNPSGPKSGSYRVLRGGAWSVDDGCHSARRFKYRPDRRSSSVGFRLARTGPWPSDTLTLARQRAAAEPVQAESEVGCKPVYQDYAGFRDRMKDGFEAPEMVYLPGGTFKMGDIQGFGHKLERPVHEVTLDAFAIGRYPVTVSEFRHFVDTVGYQTEAEQQGGAYEYDGKVWRQKADTNWRHLHFSQSDDHPVVCISWNDAVAYCEWLSKQTGERYSLPTEAEWEFACRASSKKAYFFGDDQQQLENYAWYTKNAGGTTHPVGAKQANRWGLYDLHGNVWEWVRDWYGAYLKKPGQKNPSGSETGSFRVFRGGSWAGNAGRCRSACRGRDNSGRCGSHLGFRLARRV